MSMLNKVNPSAYKHFIKETFCTIFWATSMFYSHHDRVILSDPSSVHWTTDEVIGVEPNTLNIWSYRTIIHIHSLSNWQWAARGEETLHNSVLFPSSCVWFHEKPADIFHYIVKIWKRLRLRNEIVIGLGPEINRWWDYTASLKRRVCSGWTDLFAPLGSAPARVPQTRVIWQNVSRSFWLFFQKFEKITKSRDMSF